MFTRLFFAQFALVSMIALLHALALVYDWYFYIWQLDTPMHIFGGLWVALAAVWFMRDVAHHRVWGIHEQIFTITTMLFVGSSWEVFELFTGIIGSAPADLFDSGKDIVMDTVGGCIALLLINKKIL